MIQIITKTNYIFHSLLYFQFNFYYVFYQLASHEKCFSRHEFMVFSVGLVIKKKKTHLPMEKKWVGKFPWRENGNPLQYSCLENPMDRGACWVIYSPCSHKRVRPNLRIQQEQDTFSSNHLASIFPSGSNTWIYFLELVIGQS